MDATIDFESRSPIDIKKCGSYVYWEHPLTEVMMLSVKVDDGDTQVWIPPQFRKYHDTEVSDADLKTIIKTAEVIIAHNAGFERRGFAHGMKKYGFDALPLEKIRDTSSQALMCAFPRDLDSAAKYALGGKEKKDDAGHRLMLAMSRPRTFTKVDAEKWLPQLVERGYLPSGSTWQQAKKFQSDFLAEYSNTGKGDAWLEEHFIVYRENEADFKRLVEYARQDVVVERALYNHLPKIPESELRVYQWSETVNDRGVMVNVPMVKSIKETIAQYSRILLEEAVELTEGKVKSMKAPMSIKAWMEEQGYSVDSVDKEAVKYLLSLELPDKVRRFLEIRQKLGKSSIAKYDALLNFSRTDERFRGGFVYHAAGTGRFGGSGVQVQNLPRISETNGMSSKKEVPHYEDAELLGSGDIDMIEMFWKDPMTLAADCIRYMLRAPEGKRFISADYSAVECRGLAWLAGEEATLEAFRQKKDIYKQTASGIYKIPYEQIDGGGKGPQRQIGKTATLACFAEGTEVRCPYGYFPIERFIFGMLVFDGEEWVMTEGAIYKGRKECVCVDGVWVTEDHIYYVDGEPVEAKNLPHYGRLTCDVYDLVNCGDKHRFVIKGKKRDWVVSNCGYGGGWGAMLRFGADKMGLTEEEGKEIVRAWREANPNITKLWYDLQKASMKAMRLKRRRIHVRNNISFYAGDKFLTMRLPSGRDLFYPYPEVQLCDMPWEDADGNQAQKEMVTCMFLTAAKQWVRRPLSHVTLTENLTQATCRDLLVHSAFNLEAAGYPIVMHVHDEVVCEVDENFGSLEELERVMSEIPSWAEGFPLAAEGWINWHYQK